MIEATPKTKRIPSRRPAGASSPEPVPRRWSGCASNRFPWGSGSWAENLSPFARCRSGGRAWAGFLGPGEALGGGDGPGRYERGDGGTQPGPCLSRERPHQYKPTLIATKMTYSLPPRRQGRARQAAGRRYLAVAVGTRVTSRPPHRSVRAAFPHTAPTSGINGDYMLPYVSQRL
jgi:hypothetical protein